MIDDMKHRIAWSNAVHLGIGKPRDFLYLAWCEGWSAMVKYHIAFLIQAAATDGMMPWGNPPDVDEQFRADAKRVFVELRENPIATP